ncbi:hypothetical protein PspLS_06910, partial [Pyricularia sp. CBS 133598]
RHGLLGLEFLHGATPRPSRSSVSTALLPSTDMHAIRLCCLHLVTDSKIHDCLSLGPRCQPVAEAKQCGQVRYKVLFLGMFLCTSLGRTYVERSGLVSQAV